MTDKLTAANKSELTREQWLTEVVNMAEPFFNEADLKLPKNWRVSCGFPSSGPRKAIGECHYELNSEDGVREMFVSPTLGTSVKAIKVLLHEVIHCCLGPGKGHRKEFSQAGKRLGFEGKPTQMEPADEDWEPFFNLVVETLGEYPHGKLNLSGRKKQSTRMIKVECTDEDCGCVLRMSRKWIETLPSLPICGCGCDMKVDLMGLLGS